ncbi:MAG: FAD-dependent thymidylate synthase [Fibromonadaceae bacterium]|jgi:thymidylate synthase (FAD)|nr:FAD-dependent thymidylate synthase [Fibromonadaceae bacterium]
MKVINASFTIMSNINSQEFLSNIEKFGRVCYKSENSITATSAKSFIARIIKNGHESVIEHEKITVKIVCDRGVSHEIVRHRIASYSQESTRYCNYSNDKFGNELTFIKPVFWEKTSTEYKIWREEMQRVEDSYLKLISLNVPPEQARSVLPNSLKTEIVVTMNLREWRHFFKLRTSKRAHPQMREISIPLLNEMKELLPPIFEDIVVE